MTEELKPCPFCGGEACEGDHGDYLEAFVYCQSCDLYMQGNKYNVVEKWNKRVRKEEQDKRTEEIKAMYLQDAIDREES